ncbi:MAG TPA: NADH-ubiquinone oxidoreductase-F iron-sulfur binding region domain-containing protein [Anaerovoracaceae bacterium]|nr:NADH-ubiquinone oxidoreductase-F iron-sulfur binding region domain-containing protein [Anaerovoracaceae bacterium]
MSDRTVKVCCGTGCLANGSKKVLDTFLTEIEKQKMDIEVVPYMKATGCNGLCERGPIVKIEPDDIAYYHVKPEDAAEIVGKTIAKGEEIQRLLYLDAGTRQRIRSHKDSDFMKRQTKIALRNIGEIDPCDIRDYIDAGGYQALRKAIFEMSGEDIINEIKASGLRGRGGGGFPTGMKWETCHKIDKWPKYIICNGDEGDPGAFMDRSVMEGDPHTVLEGMIIASIALNVQKGFIYIRDEYGLALENMRRAIKQAREFNYLGGNILESGHSFDIEIVRGGGAFVCGESSALMASIEGKAGEPRAKYIRSAEFGLWGQPTVLNNVETWANVPVIIQKGSEWFSKIGSPGNAGTKVFSLVGKVKNTGLVEVPMGITLEELIFDIGGGIPGDREFKAVQTGGPSGGCIPKELTHLGVDFDTLEAAGSMMGSGGMIVTDERTCMVEFARYYTAFLAEESCGKCVSCREGIRQMLKILTDICEGQGQESDLDLLAEIAHAVRQASLCGLGKTAPNPVMSTLNYFREEYLEHIVDRRCRAGVCKPLTEFYIDQEKCTGCGLCKKGCAPEAIEGSIKQPHTIDPEKCIKCGNCIDICKFRAVRVR